MGRSEGAIPSDRRLGGTYVVLSIATALLSACAGVVVNTRLTPMTGVTVVCQLAPVSAEKLAPNQTRLLATIQPACTTETVEISVLKDGTALASESKKLVVFEDETVSLPTPAFAIPPARTRITTQVVVTCTRGHRPTSGSDWCEFP